MVPKNLSSLRLQHGTSQGSPSFSFSMAIAFMNRCGSFTLRNSITSSFSVFHLILPTNCNLSMSVYLVHCNEHGWSDVTVSLNLLVQRCVKRILSTSTCK